MFFISMLLVIFSALVDDGLAVDLMDLKANNVEQTTKSAESEPVSSLKSDDASKPPIPNETQKSGHAPKRKQAEDADQSRQWNQAKDSESFNIRLNAYQGSHGRTNSPAIPPAKLPLIGPYVEYEFTDRNGDVWEKLGGSDEKLREYIAEHPEETFQDGDGKLYGANPLGFSVSIQNNIDNSRYSVGGDTNTTVNNTFLGGTSVSVDVSIPPTNIVLSTNALTSFELPKDGKTTDGTQENLANASTKDAAGNITINNTISVDTNEPSSELVVANGASAPESAYLWFLKKVGRRNSGNRSGAKDQKVGSENNPVRANTRMLASVGEPMPFNESHFNWFALAFILTAILFTARELQRVWFLIPVPSREKKKRRSAPAKPSEGTRATSATRMHLRGNK